MERQILASIIQISSCTSLLFAVLLWIRRGDNRSRVYFSVAYGVCGVDLFSRIFTIYSGTPLIFEALHPAALYMALIEIPLFLFYLIEVVNPGWLTWRRAVGLCAPWLLWNICLLVTGLHFRELHTFGDIFHHIGEVNVWLRLLFALLTLPYSIFIYSIPYNWKRSSADQSLIRIYVGGFIVLVSLFMGSSVTGLIQVSSIHLAYGIVFCFCTAYYELFIRLQVPKKIIAGNDRIDEPIASEMPYVAASKTNEGEKVVVTAKEEMWSKISREIENNQPWRNPDMSIISLADLLHTNRTTLSRLFQEQGYSGGYKEFINRRRIADFLELIDKHPQMNMQDAFFEAGFRSRTTGLRNFKEYKGMSPSEYFNSKTKKE